MTTPSPLVAALEHAVAVLRSLNAARGLVVERYTPVVTAMLDRAIAQQSALMRALNVAYEAEQAHDPAPGGRCECGQPFYLGRCVRCWARKEMGVRT